MLKKLQTFRSIASALAAVFLLLFSFEAIAQNEAQLYADPAPNKPAPAGYRREYRSRELEAVGGATLFLIGYIPALAIGASMMQCKPEPDAGCPTELGYGVIPVVGPLVPLTHRENNWTLGASSILVADALLQAAGLYLLIDGIWQRPYLVKDEKTLSMPRMSVSAAPLPGGSMFSVVGVF